MLEREQILAQREAELSTMKDILFAMEVNSYNGTYS